MIDLTGSDDEDEAQPRKQVHDPFPNSRANQMSVWKSLTAMMRTKCSQSFVNQVHMPTGVFQTPQLCAMCPSQPQAAFTDKLRPTEVQQIA